MRQRYSFLKSPTWMGWLAVCALFAVACYFLGQWQLDRREHALEEINRVVANYDEDPVPYAEAREQFRAPDAADEWTVVSLRGEYLSEDYRLARNRPHSGRVGYEQVVPFREASTGDVLAVSRGWLPTSSTDGGQPAFNPEPPSGEVELVMRLKLGEPDINRDAPEGQLASIDLQEYSSQVGYDLVPGAYGLMAEESPAPAEAPSQLPRPSLDEGPHLSYSMQWIAFGLLGFVGWGYAARLHARNRDLEALEEQTEGQHEAAGTAHRDRLREAKRAQRLREGKLNDEDLEDAWVEEHLTRSR
ncbi:SURF1 family cytochrome oxidase biogenesis protein [Nesterenkonia flava]|uniref:SURF1-like protein n=1 Tax=Nesterenkonia flava TaxID=469799 RepID=A0ABU1FU12_9MICC|nr:SURF1 family protein [Nesterenkonia flava]MDR5712103.1 SURF1 family protein [Nesterenkonia flava]